MYLKIKPGKLWIEDNLESGKEVGPVIVSEEISSKYKVGWTVFFGLQKRVRYGGFSRAGMCCLSEGRIKFCDQ